MTVSKMAQITPLQALTDDEKVRLERWLPVFAQYDEEVGKLDRAEFKYSTSQAGFTERQIAHMMAAADVSEDGLLDRGEFASLFSFFILELARADAVEKMLRGQAEQEIEDRVRFDMGVMLDELLIPLHIAYDIASGGEEGLAAGGVRRS